MEKNHLTGDTDEPFESEESSEFDILADEKIAFMEELKEAEGWESVKDDSDF